MKFLLAVFLLCLAVTFAANSTDDDHHWNSFKVKHQTWHYCESNQFEIILNKNLAPSLGCVQKESPSSWWSKKEGSFSGPSQENWGAQPRQSLVQDGAQPFIRLGNQKGIANLFSMMEFIFKNLFFVSFKTEEEFTAMLGAKFPVNNRDSPFTVPITFDERALPASVSVQQCYL